MSTYLRIPLLLREHTALIATVGKWKTDLSILKARPMFYLLHEAVPKCQCPVLLSLLRFSTACHITQLSTGLCPTLEFFYYYFLLILLAYLAILQTLLN